VEHGREGGLLVDDVPVPLPDPDGSTTGGPVPGARTADATADGDSRETAPEPLDPWVRVTGWCLLGVQLAAMVAFSTVQYRRYALTNDFANESQAWWAMAHGHLDPFIPGFTGSYWKNNAEFAMYPLSLLAHIYSQPVVLLWVQDTAVVLTELVAFAWIRKAIERSRGPAPFRAGPWLALSTVVVLVVNPWVYETIGFDFHFQTVTTLFVVLVAYDLWSGRNGRLWLWVPLALMCNALGGIGLVGVGISGMLAGRRYRRRALVIGAVGLAWFVVLSALGAVGDGGRAVLETYGYLVPHHHGPIGLADVVGGALSHPWSVVHVALSHWTVALAFVAVFGTIGLVSPWGFGMALVVLLPNVLDGSGLFIRYSTAFQSWPALPFVLVGSVMVVTRLLRGGPRGRQVAVVALAVWALFLGELAAVNLPTLPGEWISVDPAAAADLGHLAARLPAAAEVIVSQGVSGRFSQREAFYVFYNGGERIPVVRREVVFVITGAGIADTLPGHQTAEVLTYLRRRLRARVIVSSADNVYSFSWSPPPGTTTVRLP
jgi:hypothetical protein